MKATETLGHVYAYMRMRMHALNLCAHARVPENMKVKLLCIKAEVWNESHIIW